MKLADMEEGSLPGVKWPMEEGPWPAEKEMRTNTLTSLFSRQDSDAVSTG